MEKTLSTKEEKMKYTKKQLSGNSTCVYYMQIGFGDVPKFISAYPCSIYPAIEIYCAGGNEECSQQEFEQAFNTVSNRLRTTVFNDNTATRTETNDGKYTEINIKPTK